MRKHQTKKSRFIHAVYQLAWDSEVEKLTSSLQLWEFYMNLQKEPMFRELYPDFTLFLTFAKDGRQQNTYMEYYPVSGDKPAVAFLKLPIRSNEYPFSSMIALKNLTYLVAKHDSYKEETLAHRKIITYDWLTASTLLQLFRCQYGVDSTPVSLLLEQYAKDGVKYRKPRKREISPEGRVKLIQRGKELYEFKKLLGVYRQF